MGVKIFYALSVVPSMKIQKTFYSIYETVNLYGFCYWAQMFKQIYAHKNILHQNKLACLVKKII
jgi:hypothetical protein